MRLSPTQGPLDWTNHLKFVELKLFLIDFLQYFINVFRKIDEQNLDG